MIKNKNNKLLTPLKIKSMELKNRVFMAPMTRLKTLEDRSVLPMAAEYYAQRSSAGLIISEALAVVHYGEGYGGMPEFVTEAQIASWKPVVEAVHKAGGRIVAQFWHVGHRRTMEDFKDNPSRFPAPYTPILLETLTIEEFEAMPKDFAVAARKAIDLGFDAVEIHAGNSMLLCNSLRADVNQRTDEYGGSFENRSRLLLNILDAVIKEIGAERVGLKVAPNSLYQEKYNPDAIETYTHLLPKLEKLDLAYLQINRGQAQDIAAGYTEPVSIEWTREHYAGTLIAAENFTFEDGLKAVEESTLDAVAYGRIFIANPDLPERFAKGSALNMPIYETFYTDSEIGYLDYPFWES